MYNNPPLRSKSLFCWAQAIELVPIDVDIMHHPIFSLFS
jgi:hypothetical protein